MAVKDNPLNECPGPVEGIRRAAAALGFVIGIEGHQVYFEGSLVTGRLFLTGGDDAAWKKEMQRLRFLV